MGAGFGLSTTATGSPKIERGLRAESAGPLRRFRPYSIPVLNIGDHLADRQGVAGRTVTDVKLLGFRCFQVNR